MKWCKPFSVKVLFFMSACDFLEDTIIFSPLLRMVDFFRECHVHWPLSLTCWRSKGFRYDVKDRRWIVFIYQVLFSLCNMCKSELTFNIWFKIIDLDLISLTKIMEVEQGGFASTQLGKITRIRHSSTSSNQYCFLVLILKNFWSIIVYKTVDDLWDFIYLL